MIFMTIERCDIDSFQVKNEMIFKRAKIYFILSGLYRKLLSGDL